MASTFGQTQSLDRSELTMSEQNQTTASTRTWPVPSLKNALRLVILAGSVALMAAAAHASAGETASNAAAPTFTSALQMAIGFCGLALALYRRERTVEAEPVDSNAT